MGGFFGGGTRMSMPSQSAAVETPAHNCIICMQDDGYEIIGPFASRLDLIAYGERWQDEHNDDPRWQSVHLADPHAMPVVVTP